MKKIRITAILLIVATILLSSCGKTQEFEKVDVITTTQAPTQTTTVQYSELGFRGILLGMTIEETQSKLGGTYAVSITESGIPYFTLSMKDLQFVTKGTEALMYFIFDNNARLCEYQYITSEETGFELETALKSNDNDYGRHVKVSGTAGNENYVWYAGKAYIVITVAKNGDNAVSFFEKNYFEQNYKNEVAAYNKK